MRRSMLERKLADVGRPIVVVSFPRSGTHLTIDLLRRQFASCRSWKWWGERNDNLYLDFDRLLLTHFDSAPDYAEAPLGERKALSLLQRADRPIVKTHALPSFTPHWQQRPAWTEWLTGCADFLYVVRDGRKVMCSLQLMAADQSEEARGPVGAFIRQRGGWLRPERGSEESMAWQWADHVRQWRNQTEMTVLSSDDLKRDARGVLERLGREVIDEKPSYHEPLLPGRPKGVWTGRFDRLFRTRPESTALLTRSTYHRQQSWQQAFAYEDRLFFEKETNGLLEELGFAASQEWISELTRPSP